MQKPSDRTVSERGFTLIELLIAIAIIGVISGASLIRTGMFSNDGADEFQQIMTFLRLQHAKTLKEDSVRRIRFDPVNQEIIVYSAPETVESTLNLNRWSIDSSQSRTIQVSPWFIDSTSIELTGPRDNQRTLRPDWTRGFVQDSNRG